eukprot:scaffold4311_cov177-Amphora_coffeaeformis.AAC.3
MSIVSKNLGINALDVVYIYKTLGRDDFRKVLQAFGLLSRSPIDLNWECPGAPAVGHIAVDPCSCTDNDIHTTMCRGKIGKGHGYYGTWCCQKCHRKYDPRELARFRRQDPATLTKEQAERFALLEHRTKDRAAKEAERRHHHPSTVRHEARGTQERRNQNLIQTGQSRKCNPNTVSAQKKRKSKTKRESRSKKPLYPEAMQLKFIRGLQLYIHALGEKPKETLFIYDINIVLFRIVVQERKWLRSQRVEFKVIVA